MINPNIFPCFWFDGTGNDAAQFYTSVFPNAKITVNTPVVINMEFNGQKIMLLNAGPQFQLNPSISVMVMCETADEVENYYKKLSENAKVLMPLDTYPFSEKYAWVQDQFGINWQLYKGEKSEQKYIPTLMFINDNNGKCQEAMDYYINTFPNSEINSINHYPIGSTAEDVGNIANARFTINNYQLFGMDSAADYPFNFSEAISLVVMTADQEETDKYWNELTANGGQESQCGWLKDRFGVSWQIVPHRLITLMNDPNHYKSQKVVKAMLAMKKIIISDLEEAFKD